LFDILQKACLKNNITWDDALLAQIKALLGIVA
jgi:hypothetical protein